MFEPESLGFRIGGKPAAAAASASLLKTTTTTTLFAGINGHQGLVLQSIVELLCSFYEDDPENRHRLFLTLCQSLSKMKLIVGDFNYPEMAATRDHYARCFVKLIGLARRSLKGTVVTLTSLSGGFYNLTSHCSKARVFSRELAT